MNADFCKACAFFRSFLLKILNTWLGSSKASTWDGRKPIHFTSITGKRRTTRDTLITQATFDMYRTVTLCIDGHSGRSKTVGHLCNKVELLQRVCTTHPTWCNLLNLQEWIIQTDCSRRDRGPVFLRLRSEIWQRFLFVQEISEYLDEDR